MTGRLKHWFSLKGRLEREKASLKRALKRLTERQDLEAEVKALRVELDQVEGGDIISDPVAAGRLLQPEYLFPGVTTITTAAPPTRMVTDAELIKEMQSGSPDSIRLAPKQDTQTLLEKAGLTKRLSGHTAPVQEMALAILEEFSGQWLNTSQIAALIQDRFSYKIRPATTSSAIRLLRDRGVIAKKPKSWLYTFVMVPRRTAP
jgi:hypothetical protein